MRCQKERSEAVAKTTVFTYCRAPHRVRPGERVERDRLPQVFHCVHFLRLGVGANTSGWLSPHRRPSPPLLGPYHFQALAQILAHLAEEADPSKKVVLRMRWVHLPHGRDFRPLRPEGLVGEARSLSQPPLRWG